MRDTPQRPGAAIRATAGTPTIQTGLHNIVHWVQVKLAEWTWWAKTRAATTVRQLRGVWLQAAAKRGCGYGQRARGRELRRAEEPRRRLPPDKRLMEAGVEDNDLLVAVNTGLESEAAMDMATGGEIEEAEPSSDEAESEADEGATEEEGGGHGATATASWRRQSAESAIMEAVRDGMEGRGRAGAQVRARPPEAEQPAALRSPSQRSPQRQRRRTNENAPGSANGAAAGAGGSDGSDGNRHGIDGGASDGGDLSSRERGDTDDEGAGAGRAGGAEAVDEEETDCVRRLDFEPEEQVTEAAVVGGSDGTGRADELSDAEVAGLGAGMDRQQRYDQWAWAHRKGGSGSGVRNSGSGNSSGGDGGGANARAGLG